MEKLKSLVGKLAIRTQPVKLGKDFMGNENYDYSYTSNPIRIIKVTDNHIIYDRKGTDEEKVFKRTSILDKRWIDDNWTSYEELMEGVDETTR